MKRRSFLKLTAAAGASILMPNDLSAAEQIFIDTNRTKNRNQNRSTVIAQNGVVATSQHLASIAGLDILKAGGNAVDAAIAANAVLAVTEPMSCGPGGDLFAILWHEKNKKLLGLNASGRSPYNWSLKNALDMGLTEIPEYSPLSWSVPGCVSGWHALLDRFGSLPLAKVLAPAIHYAREGFPVTPIIAGYWSKMNKEKFTTLAKTFAPNGKIPEYGDIFKNPDLARFFEIIAAGGPDEFYKGQIAERIVKFSKANGGRFSLKDFHDHTADWIEPVSSNYRGYDVWELPPNGQGIAALQMLNLLEHFNIASLPPNSAEHLHLFIEAKKLAFEDRAIYYADMDFAPVPVKQLISKEYAKERVKLIDPKRAAQSVAPGRLHSSADTIYLTAADKHGNMVSLIQSTYYGFGSQIVPDNLGFALQNRGILFALDPNHMNKLQPHKRPFHTIIPAFVTKDKKPVFSFGVMGGDFQPQGHAQILMNIIDFGFSIQQAGDQPRAAHFESSTPTGIKAQGPGSVGLEKNIPLSTRQKLIDMGHKVNDSPGSFGGYQGIWRVDNPRRYFAGSDPRKDGNAIGF